MTITENADSSGPDRPGPVSETTSEKPERPSALQTLAGALTAITVTYLMSFLGVAGTVIGVGLVSILTVLGNYLYTSAMHSAKEKLKQTNLETRRRAKHPEAAGAAAQGRTADDSSTATSTESTTDSAGRWRRAWTAMTQRHGWGKILGSIGLVFALLAGTVTVIELSAGKPLSDIVRNEDSSGTTFFGGAGGDTGTEDDVTDQTDQLPPPGEDQEVPPEPDQGEVPEQLPEEDPGPAEEPQQDEQPAPEEAPQQEAPQQ